MGDLHIEYNLYFMDKVAKKNISWCEQNVDVRP